jgi:ribonucleoside-diphosphate reductase beta chain
LVGIKIVNTIREEYPELFDQELVDKIVKEAKEAFESESAIIDWMINGIKEEGLDATTLKEFVKDRINESLVQIGFPQVFEVDKNVLSATMWFQEELLGNNMTDFFKSKPTEYSKKSQCFDESELF